MATTKTATRANLMREVRIAVAQLRATAQEISLNVESMEGTQVRIAENSQLGWDDPKVAAIELDILSARADRARVLDKVAGLLSLSHAA